MLIYRKLAIASGYVAKRCAQSSDVKLAENSFTFFRLKGLGAIFQAWKCLNGYAIFVFRS